jgi:NitT/TauT family transport system substrate-binding protein
MVIFKRSFLQSLVVCIISLLASALHADELVRVGLAVPNNADYAPIFAAKELGYFKQAGLDVQITEFNGGAAAQQAMSVGAIDLCAYYGAGVGLAYTKGIKEKIVATIETVPNAWHLVVLAHSPYHSMKDLSGKTVGVTTKASTSDVLALWAASRAGVTVQTIPVGAAGQVPLLKSGQIDAIAVSPLGSLKLIATGEGRSLSDYAKEMDPTLPDLWVTPQTMIDTRSSTIQKTLVAFYKALHYMRTNRAWAITFLKKETKENDERVLQLAYDQVILMQSADGSFQSSWVSNALNMGAAMGMTGLSSVKPEDISTTAFTPVKF